MMKNKFEQLALGEVQAQGFLKTQLILQKNGITGNMEEYPDYSANSGWLGGDGESWERGPYYVRGLVALAYTLNDPKLIEMSNKWIKYALESQVDDGNFGPAGSENEWWAKMPMLMAIRDYYLVEDADGIRLKILRFFKKYFSYQLKELHQRPLDSWAKARGADNVEVILWFRDEIKKITGEDTDWLLELAEILLDQTEDWVKIFSETGVRHHVVNTTQAMKMPYLKYKITGKEEDKAALKKGLDNIRADHGRIDNLPNADEAARDNLPTRGTESCAVVEGMLSMEICGAITGESFIYDNLESYCYNSLPNAFTYDLKLHTYYQLQNEVMATHGYHGYDCDHGDSSAFGAPCGFDCCFSNSHMGYPKFVQNMWVKSEDGIAAVCYGPNKVETMHKGNRISFTQVTQYPFGNKIKFVYTGESCNFTLRLRIPEWTTKCFVTADFYEEDEYICVEKVFETGDEIELEFDSEIVKSDWHEGGCYVKKGPLLYCLPIEEEYRETFSNEYREIKYRAHDYAPNIEIYPRSRWNYALCNDDMIYEDMSKDIAENNEELYQPFCQKNAPICIRARGQMAKDWKLLENKAGVFEKIGVLENKELQEEIILVPYGCSRLKISVFPKVVEYNRNSDLKVFSLEGETAFESIIVSYDRIKDAESYIVLYGRESGCYENIIYDVKFNEYKGGGHMFDKDKFSFTVEGKGEYYIKMMAINAQKVIAETEEKAVNII